MDYSKLSDSTLLALRDGKPLDYSKLHDDELRELTKMQSPAMPQAPAEEKYIWQKDVDPNAPGMLESALRGAAQGASFGFADEITGGLEHLVTGKPYEQARDESRAAYKAAEEANPITYGLGNVGGVLASSVAIPGLSGAATVTGRAAQAAAGGALSGLGTSEESSASGLVQDAAIGGGLGAGASLAFDKVLAPAGRYIGNKISGVADDMSSAVDKALPKIGKVVANVPEDVTEKYLKNPELYQDGAVKPLDVLKDQIDAHSRRLVDSREAAKTALSGVKDEYKSAVFEKTRELDDLFRAAKDSVGDRREQLLSAIRLKKEELDDALRIARDTAVSAKGDYRVAAEDLVNDLRGVKPPVEAVDKIASGIDLLSDQVSSGSAASFDALDREGVTMSRNRLVGLINNAMKQLEIEPGVAPLSGSPARKHYEQLARTIEDVRTMPKELRGSAVKRIIQDLDDTINYIDTIGGRSGRADAATSSIRGGLNETLRNKSDAFASTMDTTARKTDLLSTLQKQFGSKEQILNRIMEMPNDKAVYKRELLQRLADETGVSVDDMLSDYMKSQRILSDKNLLNTTKASLPEYQYMQQAEAKLKEMTSTPAQRMRAAREALQGSPESEALRQAEESFASQPQTAYDRRLAAQKAIDTGTDIPARMSQAERDAMLAEEAYRNNYVSSSGSEPLIKRLMNGRKSIEDERLINRIDPQLSEDISRLRVNTAFDRPDMAGSRRTLMGTVAGKAIGGAIGGVAGYEAGGDYGAGAGAMAGFAGDKYAGKIFKAVLDGRIAAGPQLQRIAPALGKYAGPILNAAQRGNAALAATHFILSQRDPQYRQTVEKLNQGTDNE